MNLWFRQKEKLRSVSFANLVRSRELLIPATKTLCISPQGAVQGRQKPCISRKDSKALGVNLHRVVDPPWGQPARLEYARACGAARHTLSSASEMVSPVCFLVVSFFAHLRFLVIASRGLMALLYNRGSPLGAMGIKTVRLGQC